MNLLLQQVVNGLILSSTYVLIATGLMLIFGVLSAPSLAHGEFFMLGAFATFAFEGFGLPFVIALLIAAVALGIGGIVLDVLTFRPYPASAHLPMMLGSFGISTIMVNVATIIWTSDPQSVSMPINGVLQLGPVRIDYYELVMIVVTALLIAAMHVMLQHTRIGLAIRVMAANKSAAMLVGISETRVRSIVFALGCAFAAVAGALFLGSQPITTDMGTSPMVKSFIIIVIGGIGKLRGAVLAALLLGMVEVFVSGYLATTYRDFVTFGILVLILIFRPEGLFGAKTVRD